MPLKSPTFNSTDPFLADVLEAVSLGLLAIFLAAVVVSAWPPKLLDPQCQLGLTKDLINNGSLVLLGAMLTPSGSGLPSRQRSPAGPPQFLLSMGPGGHARRRSDPSA
jgi:hypothetical protein